MQFICLWSGTRNVSTALMYSFAQRADTQVVDEPLYGHYLRVSGAAHPGREEIMAAVNCDGDAVMRDLLSTANPPGTTVLFAKQMAHHLVGLDTAFLEQTQNVLLIRDPADMLPSLTVQLPDATLGDTGLETQWRLFQSMERVGQSPAVIDSRELLLDPAGVLAQLCAHLELEFDEAMLEWPAGPRAEDGIWAKYWYHAVHTSTGFQPYRPKTGYPDRLRPLLDECRPFYDKLYARAIRGNGESTR